MQCFNNFLKSFDFFRRFAKLYSFNFFDNFAFIHSLTHLFNQSPMDFA